MARTTTTRTVILELQPGMRLMRYSLGFFFFFCYCNPLHVCLRNVDELVTAEHEGIGRFSTISPALNSFSALQRD